MLVNRVLEFFSFVCCALPARGLHATLNWETSRKFWFTFLTVTIVCAKLLHIYAHWGSIPVEKLLLWSSTFFLQDIAFLLVGYVLTLNFKWKSARILAGLVVVPSSLVLSVMAAANISFFFLTGAEIHWRQAGSFNRDPASVNTLLTGLTGLFIVEIIFLGISFLASPYPFNCIEAVVNVWGQIISAIFEPVAHFILSRLSRFKKGEKLLSNLKIYERLPLTDYEDDEEKDLPNSTPLLDQPPQPKRTHNTSSLVIWFKRSLFILPVFILLLLQILRPVDKAYSYLSQTLIISPFGAVDPKTRLAGIIGGSGDLNGKRTALGSPPSFDWLPEGDWPGFRDWELSSNGNFKYQHYNSTDDPLHISNLDQDILEPLRDVIKSKDFKIKHVLVFKMESTRYDVFPLRNGSYMHKRILETYKGDIPKKVQQRLANLTHTAERLTGTESGLHKNGTVKPYGGIYATNSHTGGTFTLKSIEATTCGLSPLVMDFNHEYEQHIYQPCMPHVLDVLSAKTNNSKSNDFVDWPWRPRFMQSITDTYDHQDLLTPALGFKPENILTAESIEKEHQNDASFHGEKFNFWGYPDHDLAGYFRDAINQAERDHERLFITHLTGITHHPWDTPGKHYDELVSTSWGGNSKDINKYLNTIGINDKWFGQVLDILEETGIANETLVIMTGDHGLSLLEDNSITPYDNPKVANFHVPLVISNPLLPPIEVNSSVSSVQILPTILDLLKESGSLDEYSSRAIGELLPMYEGQSIIRPIITETEETQYYQFTVMNTGGSMVAMRSASHSYRLVIPLIPGVEWRFSDPESDPQEDHPIKTFDLNSLRDSVALKFGPGAVEWLNKAAKAGAWWVADNWRRYEYTPK